MKNQKLAIVYILLLVLFCSTGRANANINTDGDVNLYGIFFRQPRGLDGSPFLFNIWSMATITLYNGQVANDVRTKFNILTNDLIFYNEKFKNLFTIDRETVISFDLDSGMPNKLHFIKYKGEPIGYKLKIGEYVHQVYSGRMQLLAKYSASISDANDISSKDKIYPRNYYFIVDGIKTSEIKLNIRSLIKLYPEKKKMIKKTASQIHFHKKSLEDMTHLIEALE